jgi:predicted acetyltransferase
MLEHLFKEYIAATERVNGLKAREESPFNNLKIDMVERQRMIYIRELFDIFEENHWDCNYLAVLYREYYDDIMPEDLYEEMYGLFFKLASNDDRGTVDL